MKTSSFLIMEHSLFGGPEDEGAAGSRQGARGTTAFPGPHEQIRPPHHPEVAGICLPKNVRFNKLSATKRTTQHPCYNKSSREIIGSNYLASSVSTSAKRL